MESNLEHIQWQPYSELYKLKNGRINQFNIPIDGSNRNFSILTKSNNFLSIQQRWVVKKKNSTKMEDC